MIKAIIFDVGGVLIRTEDPGPRRALEVQYGLEPGQAEYMAFNSPLGQAAQRGEITTQALWAGVAEQLGLDSAQAVAFETAFFAGDRMDQALVDFIRSLRPRYATGIISNALDNLTHVITDLYPMADAFDVVIGSAAEKVMKPNPGIYRAALDRLGVSGPEAVFIDDFAHNLVGAQALGIHGIHFVPGIDVPAELAKLGVRGG